jgi:hypothetical protein
VVVRRDHLPGWIHAKNVIEAILGDSFNLALSEASSSQSLNVPASAITWRQLLCGIELYNSIRGSTAVMAPGHDSVLGSVLTPGHRDSFQRRAWREAVLEKLFQVIYSAPTSSLFIRVRKCWFTRMLCTAGCGRGEWQCAPITA